MSSTKGIRASALVRSFWASEKPGKMWRELYTPLSRLGWTWPRFTALLSLCGAEVVWYMTGDAEWDFLKDMIFGFASGPVGKAVIEGVRDNVGP